MGTEQKVSNFKITSDGKTVKVNHFKMGTTIAHLKTHVGRVFTKDFCDVDDVYGESFGQWAERVESVWGVKVGEEHRPRNFRTKEVKDSSLKFTLGDLLKEKLLK